VGAARVEEWTSTTELSTDGHSVVDCPERTIKYLNVFVPTENWIQPLAYVGDCERVVVLRDSFAPHYFSPKVGDWSSFICQSLPSLARRRSRRNFASIFHGKHTAVGRRDYVSFAV
jgi:hypothetical protein